MPNNAAIYYDPTDDGATTTKKEFEVLPEGKYFCHIVDYMEPVINLTKKNGDLCNILKLVLTIDANKHPQYADRKIWADVWVTLEKNGKQPSSSDNQGFGKFLDAIHYPCDKTQVEINGVTKEVNILPFGVDEIDEDHIVGKPLLATTYISNWTGKDGSAKQTAKVRFFDSWDNGEPLEQEEDDDLPF